MDAIIQRYLDGELNRDESRRFLALLENDPDFEKRVTAMEAVAGFCAGTPVVDAKAGFADRVMDRVAAERIETRPVESRHRGRALIDHPLPLAASWLLALGLGYFFAAGLPYPRTQSFDAQSIAAFQEYILAADDPAGVAGEAYRVVRLAHVPASAGVSRVELAGSFNDWNPAGHPMHLENGRWVTTLLLPPDTYEYMFVEDGETWVTDPLATATRDDGFGSTNAILEVGI